MNNRPSTQSTNLIRAIKKLFLSAFVVLSFILYALHKPFASANPGVSAASPLQNPPASQPVLTAPPAATDTAAAPPQDTSTAPASAPPTDTVPPTDVPQPTDVPTQPAPTTPALTNGGQYKNGTYTGSEVDAYYGLVQVRAVIQNGKIANVQFTEFPNDRRTSQRINSIAMPYLQQEAIQAQNANVDMVSGATLTSQAFIMSLQSALDQAKG